MELEQALKKSQSEYEELREQTEILQQVQETLQTSHISMEQQLSPLQLDNMNKDHELKAVQKEVDNLRKVYHSCSEENLLLKNQLYTLQLINKTKTDELTKLRVSLQGANQVVFFYKITIINHNNNNKQEYILLLLFEGKLATKTNTSCRIAEPTRSVFPKPPHCVA
ncbi:Response regulator receiver [Reticulomyxa filosa]|uniref:Response regulator receiver n=1 Tax=Reticulomyxa filosa TaxID=46433 RepID=X6N1Q2_RETFI|nr:Response regulator receiver [Reticulomyxa filosa]|eukprot:ETO19828.1 Response regulator receiver [Reticulomyxa filosa]